MFLGELDVPAPDRKESPNRSCARIGLLDSFDLEEHPSGEVQAGTGADLSEKRIAVGEVTVDRRRGHIETARDFAERDRVRSARSSELAGFGQDGSAEVAMVIRRAGHAAYRSR